MIFVALAIAWAVYLIPKALQHSEEMARSRGVDRFSSRMRVFGGAAEKPVPADVPAPEPAVAPAPSPVAARPLVPTRAAARRAAARRRKVLYALALVLVAVGVAAYLGRLPAWSVAIPLVLIVAFLVVARLTVRREQVRYARYDAAPAGAVVPATAAAEPAAGAEGESEDTIGLNRTELAEPDAIPLADEGSLWDPLPMTLPTYVSKPQARRTVRTIELTRTAQSSGHDPVDSALVRQAEAAEAEVAEEAPEAMEEPPERRVAGA
jgi:hypothetical protein